MRCATIVVLAIVALAAPTHAAECHGSPDPNAQPNLNPIYTTAPVFVREVKNAKLFTTGPSGDEINIVHLWGSPYEMGFAHGTLMRQEASAFMNAVWTYLEQQVESAINGTVHNLKPWFVQLVSEIGMDAALDWTIQQTQPYTGPYFNEEILGMADATGVPAIKITRIHMIGELTKGSCSMYGAWGSATASTGSLLQLRALDWDVTGPFKNFPQITVYHPTLGTGNGHAFANIGWTGWVGSITGISSVQTAISEIGVSFPDSSFGKESRAGVPFTYILRDVLQFDETLEDTIHRIKDAHRTCDLIFGFGDGKKNGGFRSCQYSASVANFFDDTNMLPNATWHPLIENVVYYGMDWLCPGYDEVLARQLNVLHGNITPENTISNITAIVQTGDLHIAIYDLTNMILHTANARRDSATGPTNAYDRTFSRLDMNDVFAETKPLI